MKPDGWPAPGWSSTRPKTSNEILLNGQHLWISCIIWQGASQCPIEKHFSDKYFGYERGDRDWFVTNLDRNISMFLPDLLPSQIGMFGFFQGLESSFRIDPETYIKVFGLDSNEIQKPLTLPNHRYEDKWIFHSGPVWEQHINNHRTTIDVIENTIYDARLVTDENENHETKHLFIRFFDRNYLQEHKEDSLTIFDIPLPLQTVEPWLRSDNNKDSYADCVIRSKMILEERDDSETMDKIRRDESPGCVIC